MPTFVISIQYSYSNNGAMPANMRTNQLISQTNKLKNNNYFLALPSLCFSFTPIKITNV